jgi:rare lipoprotein A
MRTKSRTSVVLLALLACCIGSPAALAATGGASAPEAASPSSGTGTVLPTTAIATWFGPGFYGHRTACGQTLTPEVVGVANRTLPCGTLVKVAYRGRTLTVPVIDRGPYGRLGARWDLTAGAATALGITETVRIHAIIVGSTANSPALGLPAPVPTTPEETLAGGAAAA